MLAGYKIDEFWRLTLAEFLVVCDALERENELQDRRVALICASIYNSQRTKKQKPVKINDFMPKKSNKKQDAPTKARPEQMLKMAEFLTQVVGGIDKRKGRGEQ